MHCEIIKLTIGTSALIALAACGISHDTPHGQQPAATMSEPAAPSPQTFAIGLQLTPSGGVVQDSTADAYPRGHVVYVAVNVAGASAVQHIGVQWKDPSGRVRHEEMRTAPTGTQFVAFSSGPTANWQPGACKATVAINGRIVTELPFELM